MRTRNSLGYWEIPALVTWRTVTDLVKRRPEALRLADRLGRGRGRFRWLDGLWRPNHAAHRPDLRDWDKRDMAAVWIGHATVLIRIGGKTILTDPVLSSRVGLSLGIATGGPLRLVAPALGLNQLPPIDVILLSHAHYDHLDRPTLARLPKSAQVITAGHTRDLVQDLGFARVTELEWGQSHTVGGLVIRACEVRHWGARTFVDQHRHACGYVIEADGRRVLFGGDSAFGHHFRPVGRVDLAILGIGAYDPWIAGHATPEQAWQMANDARADFVLPMHHSTFRLSHEPMDEPIFRLQEVAGRGADRIVVREVGGSWSLN